VVEVLKMVVVQVADKLTVIMIIIGFWLVLPIPLMLLNYNSTDINFLTDNINAITEPSIQTNSETTTNWFTSIQNFFGTIFNVLFSIFAIIGIFFKIMILGIDGTPPILNTFFIFLKFISAIVVFLLLRGD
jgi:uncharacterized membrane protein